LNEERSKFIANPKCRHSGCDSRRFKQCVLQLSPRFVWTTLLRRLWGRSLGIRTRHWFPFFYL